MYLLQASITRSESKPKVKLTEQTWTEVIITYTYTVEGVPAWRELIVSADIYAALRKKSIKSGLNLIKLGRFVNYRDDQDRLLSMFGWGISPSKVINTWFNRQYGM